MEKLNLNNERIEITVLRNFIFNEAFHKKGTYLSVRKITLQIVMKEYCLEK
jgi:hypothetical protein